MPRQSVSFSPADQVSDFPAARLAGDYALGLRDGTDLHSRIVSLKPSPVAECVRYTGRTPPAGASRFALECGLGLCDSGPAGRFSLTTEFSVGPGEHPEIIAFQRTPAPEALLVVTCVPLFFGIGPPCVCPPGWSFESMAPGRVICSRADRPMVCTESHRIAEQNGVIHGLPLRATDASIQLFPVR